MPALIVHKFKAGFFLLMKTYFTVLIWLAVVSSASLAASAGGIVKKADGKLFIRAQNLAFKDIAAALHKDFALEIKGTANLEAEKISLTYEAASLEELVRGLLRYLNIKNYAFEFADDKLKTVNLIHDTGTADSGLAGASSDSLKQRETVTVAVVNGIVESSQAENLDLRPGDVIIEYGGTRIHNAAQLVKEVKNNSNKNQIEMMVVRDGASRHLLLQGGFIGIRITTDKVSKQSYQNYF